MKYLPLILLLGCATWPRGFLFQDTKYPVKCTTVCGLELLEPAPWSCGDFQALEIRALTAFHTVTHDIRFLRSCERLKKWDVMVSPGKNVTNAQGVEVGGDTSCGQRRIFVGNPLPEKGRLAHELAHAIQECQPVDDGRDYFDQHYRWEPIYAALQDAGLPE